MEGQKVQVRKNIMSMVSEEAGEAVGSRMHTEVLVLIARGIPLPQRHEQRMEGSADIKKCLRGISQDCF